MTAYKQPKLSEQDIKVVDAITHISDCCGAPVWKFGGNLHRILETYEYFCEKCKKHCSPVKKENKISFRESVLRFTGFNALLFTCLHAPNDITGGLHGWLLAYGMSTLIFAFLEIILPSRRSTPLFDAIVFLIIPPILATIIIL